MIQFCLSMPTASEFDLTSLETIMYGASPMSQALLKQAFEHFPNAKFFQGTYVFVVLLYEALKNDFT